MNRPGRTRDAGSVTGFVVVIATLFLALAGLAVDGARIVAAKMTAADHAENAARAGAQEVDALRDGGFALDPAGAVNAASAYLASVGASGDVFVTAGRVTVTVTVVVDTTLLRVAGVSSKRVSATRSSDPVSQNASGGAS